ncbi:hypothetical protein DLJ49_17490 [Rhodovulum sp. 12E13]|uniref:hypothetical protein n=1 Tax=Rhodovulum sp. 12E13 TaxID=2203891 RepID=UPI000E130CD2|nr:hypothetical protein [Rhodovulum sp. 12E13]RDC69937.1 hypothetical protein DLJ49_17490 [Rhodovulum sp. 12E13]
MLDVLILEPDPIIALDLSEAVRAADRRARVELVETVSEACGRCAGRAGLTHGFVRMLSEKEQAEAQDLVATLTCSGATVVLLGAEAVPEGVAFRGRVTCLPFPFSAHQVDRLLGTPPPPPPTDVTTGPALTRRRACLAAGHMGLASQPSVEACSRTGTKA